MRTELRRSRSGSSGGQGTAPVAPARVEAGGQGGGGDLGDVVAAGGEDRGGEQADIPGGGSGLGGKVLPVGLFKDLGLDGGEHGGGLPAVADG